MIVSTYRNIDVLRGYLIFGNIKTLYKVQLPPPHVPSAQPHPSNPTRTPTPSNPPPPTHFSHQQNAKPQQAVCVAHILHDVFEVKYCIKSDCFLERTRLISLFLSSNKPLQAARTLQIPPIHPRILESQTPSPRETFEFHPTFVGTLVLTSKLSSWLAQNRESTLE